MADVAWTDILQSEYGFKDEVVRVGKHVGLHRFTAIFL